MISTGKHHLTATLSLTLITLNLLFWIPPLVMLPLLRLLAPYSGIEKRWRDGCDKLVVLIYQSAVRVDNLVLRRLSSLHINIDGVLPKSRNQRYLIVSNHRSWFDILLLQMLVTSHGPIIKFLIKRELVYVPVVGWICLALNFPRLRRGTNTKDKRADYDSVASAALDADSNPFALLNFVEGTRFTQEKHQRQRSPYQHMLKPKVGGLRIMLNNMPDIEIIDVTLVYPKASLTFWQLLSGKVDSIDVHLRYYASNQIDDLPAWLKSRWLEKDARLRKKLGSARF